MLKENSNLLFQLVERQKNESKIGYESIYPHILFMLGGCIKLIDKSHNIKYISAGQCLFIPKNEPTDFTAVEDTRFILLLFSRQTFLEDGKEFNPEGISHIERCTHPVMNTDTCITNFLENLLQNKSVFYNDNYQRIKAEEVHLIARNRYPYSQITWFLQSIIRPSDDFKAFVEINYNRVKNVPELAKLAGMCETTFRSKFTQTFNEPVYAWMMKQTAIEMRNLIEHGETRIKTLMSALRFKHKSSFIRFCNRWMGGNPSDVIANIAKSRR